MRTLLIGGAGYVGSEVFSRLAQDGHEVHVCDSLRRGNPARVPIKYACDANDLASEDLLDLYDRVIWLAGCSNVRDSLSDPLQAIADNVMTLTRVALQLDPRTRLIYASTASLYSSSSSVEVGWSSEDGLVSPGSNGYDVSKYCFDYIARSLLNNFVSLRFGTVAGHSLNPRNELILNAMCLSGDREGVVRIANPDAWRSIVFLEHVGQVVSELVSREAMPTSNLFINVASLTDTIGGFGTSIAKHLGVDIEVLPPTPVYSFRMSTALLTELDLGGSFTLESEIDKFLAKTNGN